jgi:drug/metabolite transporter (DMT)-like permease
MIDWIGLIAGIIAAAIWGGMYVVSKVVLEVVPPFTLLTMRLVLGALTLIPFLIKKGGLNLTRLQLLNVLGIGFIGYGISLGFQFVGTKLSTAANGALVTSATPAFVLLFAAVILGEKISRLRLVALGLASLGVLIVIDPQTARLSPGLFWGNLSLVLAALTWALYSVLIRKATRGMDVLPVSFYSFLGGLLLTIPAMGVEFQVTGVGSMTMGVLVGILYLGVISTGLAMYLWNLAFTKLEAGIASLTFFAQPVVGAGLGALLLGEQLGFLFLVGAVLIAAGLLIAARS